MGADERVGPARVGNGLIENAVDNAVCLERRTFVRRSLLQRLLLVNESAVAKDSPKVSFLSLANDIASGYCANKISSASRKEAATATSTLLMMMVIAAWLFDRMGYRYLFSMFNEGVMAQVGLPVSASLQPAWKASASRQPISLSNIGGAVRWSDVHYAEVDEPSRQMMLHRSGRLTFLFAGTADNFDWVSSLVRSKTCRQR